jgi:hypothetical protein
MFGFTMNNSAFIGVFQCKSGVLSCSLRPLWLNKERHLTETLSLTIYDLPREMTTLPFSWGELLTIFVEFPERRRERDGIVSTKTDCS